MINHDRICYRECSAARAIGAIRASYFDSKIIFFETIGVHTCMYAGARRRRRLWRIVNSDNGIAYYRNRDGWFVPVGSIKEVTA